MFFWLALSFFDPVAINPNGIKTPLANSFGTFSIKGNPVFNSGPKSLPNNSRDCPIYETEFLITSY